MDSSAHILVVDDHHEIRDLLSKYLSRNGFRVSEADGGTKMRQVLKTAAIDLIVLDVMMPGEDGLTLCRHVRETENIPVILLTALGEETDRIVGLEIGADDYVTKPFNPRELLARIKSVLRRSQSVPAAHQIQHDEDILEFDGWRLYVARRELLSPAGVTVPLSAADFRLLVTFLQRPSLVLSRDQLLDLTSGRTAQLFDRSIDNQVSRLRKKIEEDPKAPKFIKTVRGGGYVFAAKVSGKVEDALKGLDAED
ncbi:response regulator [Cohaesibacter gelatinilyticus]|uniref:Regulatory protein VirG n=1 Tax=Cohaesibacter gelatinilyticus TaxID=372072 RepID=A0A285NCZ3_9HYPH|nr:response regulator [Cohaesibacter gelatinilyticus]SNZ05796.1 two-component system, OmpR family, response regulator [Cohaesibacter gelatinilyticus]HAT87242.1 DNA-binding response regulator [Hyphomicrobiales bacterium]